ncbi:putative mitochondrial hypothetical protein [Leptomonas pyrrhocoris]|uniref:Uncharacterized protein n=1 Tax=Leptomonas pyrrhocoris TaxID=157538 RepID=A0A0N0VEL8_LEPPY|nr:putative mitochondrial hypothetical protein [Leptomonas pyrrhocoris]KPA78628.1 putative mitochondrial hypothetical protein [Leptomonas pyrrhocoris]|eukprot:XP_015657067.1 putative mitochondrial hypothetical protein [Leptomonas pyrrhocoris]
MLRLCITSSPAAAVRGAAATLLQCARCELATSATAMSSSSLSSSSALCFSRRYQRSTSTRARTSTWEEKTKKFEERRREQQEEAARAARRRARYTSTACGAAAAPAFPSSSSAFSGAAHADAEELSSSASQDSLAKPSTGLWDFLRGGNKGRLSQPLNPLMYLERMNGKSQYDPDARAAQRLIDAVNGLRRRNPRRQDSMTVQLSETEKQEIVRRYASTRWYGALYNPFKHVTEGQIRWGLRLGHIGLALLILAFLVCVLLAFTKEMDTVAKLSPEDQRDYAYMVRGMRYSDIYKVGKAVLDSDDPLDALPPEVRLHIVIDACREKRWHQVDWDMELRTMHPKSAWEERDVLHLLYWTVAEVGRAMSGGGGLFTDRILDVGKVRQGSAESPEERDRFVEMEPTAMPTRTTRGFFS